MDVILLPKNPTPEMIRAGYDETFEDCDLIPSDIERIYKAMVKAWENRYD